MMVCLATDEPKATQGIAAFADTESGRCKFGTNTYHNTLCCGLRGRCLPTQVIGHGVTLTSVYQSSFGQKPLPLRATTHATRPPSGLIEVRRGDSCIL